MKRYNRRTLVMNSDYMPINIKHWTDAICLITKGKATQIDFYKDDEIKDGHGRVYPVPAVIVLNKYIKRNYRHAPFSKNNVFARDKYQCAYCCLEFKASELTMDHVIPRSKWMGAGTPTCWTNIVTACRTCNAIKDDKRCNEVDMYPVNRPVQPGYDEIFFGLHIHGKIEREWITWLKVFPSFKEMAERLEYEEAEAIY